MGQMVDMLCLANSEKNGERCVAGVRLDTGDWIRPVSDKKGSALLENQYRTASGQIPKPLDSVRLELRRQYPQYNQPENWIIAGTDWELLTSEMSNPQLLALNTVLQRSGSVIMDSRLKIPKHELKEEPILNSLTVLHPRNPEFFIKKDSGTKKPRVSFTFDENEYSLPITDPAWRRRAETQGVDSLPTADSIPDSDTLVFTISLGEAFEGFCYKIVANVFTVHEDLLLDI